jgi:hypothetical protein
MNETSFPQTSSPTTHHTEATPRSDAGAPPESGRGSDGKFVKGNKGGPGNPFARKLAAMRRAFFAAVTKEDLAAIAQAMIEKAKAGDVAAARLVIQYTMGRPAEAVDPDRLDEMEWQQWQRELVGTEMPAVMTGVHAECANTIARKLVPAMQEQHMGDLHRQCMEREEERREEAAEDEREAAREARRKARRAERRAAQEAAPAKPRTATPAQAAGPATADSPPVARSRASESPTGAHCPEDGGQRPPTTARQRDAERVLQMLDAAVNKRPLTEHHAANDFTD